MDLATKTWGDGPQTALLLHGIGSNKEGWWRVGPALAELGYTVVAPDLRGHGESPRADRYLLADLATDARSLGDHWDLLWGHSLGGAVAVTMLATEPDLAEQAVLEDPALFLPGPEITLPMLLEEYAHPLDVETHARLNPLWHPEDVRIKVEALTQCSPEVFEAIVTDNPRWNFVEETVALRVPTLVLGAGVEPIVPAEMGEGLAALSDRIEFVQVPGSSHSMHRDEFESMMGAVRNWLSQH